MSIQRAPQSPPLASDVPGPGGPPGFGQTVVLPTNAAVSSTANTSSPLAATYVASASDLQSTGPTTSPGSGASSATGENAAVASRYQTVRQIGEGGMGEVVLSRDPTIGRQVAVKRMKRQPVESPGAAERFMTEVQTTGKLEHPGIVPIYDAGFDVEGNPYFVMKYVRTQKTAAISRSSEGGFMPLSDDLNHTRRAPTSSPGITLGSDRSSGGPRWEI